MSMLLAVLIFASSEGGTDNRAAVFEMQAVHGVADSVAALLNEELVTRLA